MAKGGNKPGGGGGTAFGIIGLDPADDTGTKGDGVTSTTTGLTFTGTIDGSIQFTSFTITLTAGSGEVIEGTYDPASGASTGWTFTFDGNSWTATYDGSLLDTTYTASVSYVAPHPKNGRDQTTNGGSYAFEIDATAPGSPSVVSISGHDLTGTAESGATILVHDASDSLVTSTTADGTGAWSLTIQADGTFSIYAEDAAGNRSQAFASVELGVNAPPVAQDDTASTAEDTAVTISVLDNDTDPDGNPLSVTSASAANGTVVVNPDNTLTYTPNLNFNGSDSITYEISDGNGGTDTATVSVTVTEVDDAPIARDDSYTTAEDTTITLALAANDTEPDGDSYFVSEIVSVQGDGTLVPLGDNLSYDFTPDPDFNGVAIFDYRLSDGTNTSNWARVTIDVTPVPDPPTATADGVTTEFQTAATIDVLANDFDPDGDEISLVSVGVGANGSTAINPDGTVTYTPDAGFEGTDSFTYVISDGTSQSTGTVTVTVRPEVDVTPPAAPTIDLAAASDSGWFDDDDITRVVRPLLTGTAEAGATVEVFDGAASIGTAIADAAGNWSLAPAQDLGSGVHSLTARATDAAGNASAPSGALAVTIDTGTDTPVITAVLTSAGNPAGTITDDATPTIEGTGEAGARVRVLVDGTAVGTVIVGSGGTWSFTVPVAAALADGLHSISADAEDAAGNLSSPSAAYQIEVDAVPDDPPPPPPSGQPYTPDDPLYSEQWHLTRIGDIETVWGDYTGAGVRIGIYDNGIEYTHEDLYANYDLSNELAGGGSMEHGTAVAGVIAAVDNDRGIVGVAFGATISGINIFDGPAYIDGAGTSGNTYQYVINEAASRFDVISLSWGTLPDWSHANDPTTTINISAFRNIGENGRGGLGGVIVKAAGNESGNANGDYINTQRWAIIVGAHDSGNAAAGVLPDGAYYSNRGANLLVSAPSSGALDSGNLGVMTTDLTSSGGYNTMSGAAGDYTGTGSTGFGGTSSATPVVSGVVSLMLDANPGLGWRDVQEVLAYSANRIDGTPGAYDAAQDVFDGFIDLGFLGIIPIYKTRDVAGQWFDWFENDAYNANGGGLHYSNDYGFGGVDAYGAVRMAEVWSLFHDPTLPLTDPGAMQTSQNELFVGTGAVPLSLSAFGEPITIDYDYTATPMNVETVEVYVWWSADQLENISIDLIAPSGTEVNLLKGDGNATGADDISTNTGIPLGAGAMWWKFTVKGLLGEEATGTWTIRVYDEEVGGIYDNLAVSQYGLQFYGDVQVPEPNRDDVYHYTSEMLSLGYTSDPTRVNLSDAGGEDWLNLAAMPENLQINLQDSASSYANAWTSPVEFIRLAPGTVIENAVTGDGHDQIAGNDAGNELYGMRGNDTLEGGAGADTLAGGVGDDELWGGGDADRFVFGTGGGDDWIGDFTQASDKVVLSGFGVATTAGFGFATSGTDQVMTIDADSSITFAGGATWSLTDDDFIFDDTLIA